MALLVWSGHFERKFEVSNSQSGRAFGGDVRSCGVGT
jgi:hypothetical protein